MTFRRIKSDQATGVGPSDLDTLRVVHATDVGMSVSVTGFTASVQVHLATDDGDTVMDETNDAVRVNIVADDATLVTRQVSGAASSVEISSQPLTLDIRQVSGSTDSVNVTTLAGTAVATDSGVAGTGVLRTVHVTDVAVSVRAISNSGVDIGDVDILSIAAGDNNIGNVDIVTMPSVTIGTFPDNEPFNVAQWNGVATSNGDERTAGTLRIVHVGDVGTSVNVIAALPTGSNVIGALSANQSVNAAQINGLATGFGSGVDNTGVLRIVHVTDVASSVQTLPSALSGSAPSNADSTAYTSGLSIKASAGVLYAVSGYNSSTSVQFINVHNKATAVADADVPTIVLRIPATSNFYFSPSEKFGKYFATGMMVTNSSTGPTSTTQAADCWFSCLYF